MENNKYNYNKMLFESVAGVNSPENEEDKYFSESGMSTISVLENILNRLTDKGIGHKFQGNILCITHNSYTTEKVIDKKNEIEEELNKIVAFVKNEFKDKTGKAITLKEVSEDFSSVATYTSFKQTLIQYSKL